MKQRAVCLACAMLFSHCHKSDSFITTGSVATRRIRSRPTSRSTDQSCYAKPSQSSGRGKKSKVKAPENKQTLSDEGSGVERMQKRKQQLINGHADVSPAPSYEARSSASLDKRPQETNVEKEENGSTHNQRPTPPLPNSQGKKKVAVKKYVNEVREEKDRHVTDHRNTVAPYLTDLDQDIWDDDDDQVPVVEEDYFDIPFGDMLGSMAFDPKEEGGLCDSTLEDICYDYSFPVEFIVDVLCRWGVTPPIKLEDKLGDLVNGEQAYAVVECLNSVDSAWVHDFYIEDTIEELAWELEVPLSDIFAVCGRQRLNLPMGTDTHLTKPEYRILLRELGLEEELMELDEAGRRDFDPEDTSKMFMSSLFNGDPDEMFKDEVDGLSRDSSDFFADLK